MRMMINPSTMEKCDSKRRLVFDYQSMKFISLAKGEKLILDHRTLETTVVRKRYWGYH